MLRCAPGSTGQCHALCLPEKSPGTSHTSQDHSCLSSHFPVCLGQCPKCLESPKTFLCTPRPDAKFTRRHADRVWGSGMHPLWGALYFTGPRLGSISVSSESEEERGP